MVDYWPTAVNLADPVLKKKANQTNSSNRWKPGLAFYLRKNKMKSLDPAEKKSTTRLLAPKDSNPGIAAGGPDGLTFQPGPIMLETGPGGKRIGRDTAVRPSRTAAAAACQLGSKEKCRRR